MARKNTPFQVFFHYTKEKSRAEIQKLYIDFYIKQVQNRLEKSGLREGDKRAIIDRLIAHHSQNALGKNTSRPQQMASVNCAPSEK